MPLDHVRNEQTKLLATALNTTATSSFTVGVLAPIAAAIYTSTGAAIPIRVILFAAAVWFSVAVTLHFLVRRVLRSLKP